MTRIHLLMPVEVAAHQLSEGNPGALSVAKAALKVEIHAGLHDELLELAGDLEMTVDEFAEVSYREAETIALAVGNHDVTLRPARRRRNLEKIQAASGKPDPDGGRVA